MLSACEDLRELLSTFETSKVFDGWVEEEQSWTDYGFEEGSRVLLMFQDSDWEELERFTTRISNTGLHFLAQWLGSSEDPRAVQLLCSLLPIGSGSAWFMCADSLSHKWLQSPEAIDEQAFHAGISASFDACTGGVVSFINRPVLPAEGFPEYLARYKHMLSPNVLALVERIQESRGRDA